MGDIFNLELNELASSTSTAALTPAAETFNLSEAEAASLYEKYDFSTVKRIEHARKVLGSHSWLLKHAKDAHQSLAHTRARFLAQTLPHWTPEAEKDLFTARPHHQTISKDAPVTTISPSTEFGDIGQESRPSSMYTPGSASYTTSPHRHLRGRHE